MDENPGVKFGEISRIVAERWRGMSDADKQVSTVQQWQTQNKDTFKDEHKDTFKDKEQCMEFSDANKQVWVVTSIHELRQYHLIINYEV